MLNNIDELHKKLSDLLKSDIKSEFIIGKQFQFGEFSCMPVISIFIGFGNMSGEGQMDATEISKGNASGEGTGYGLGMIPIGFLVTKGNEIQFISSQNGKGLLENIKSVQATIGNLVNKKVKTRKS